MATLVASPPMVYTIFEDVQGTKSKLINGTWEDLVRTLESPPEYPSKERCPLLKLATFGDERSRQGRLRTNTNMLTISGVEGDYDGGMVSPEEAVAKLNTANHSPARVCGGAEDSGWVNS